MEEEREQVVSPSTEGLVEERMLGQELVREMIARRERGDGIKRIARELGVDRKTVKRWLKVGGWQPRQPQRRNRQLDCFAEFIERRAPEVGFNAVVLHRELQALGFPGGLMQVQRFVRPYREQRRWAELATVRFETGRVSKPRSTTVSSGSGSVRSRRRFIYLCSRWAIRAGCTRGPIAMSA